jgi:hypothetical protein
VFVSCLCVPRSTAEQGFRASDVGIRTTLTGLYRLAV